MAAHARSQPRHAGHSHAPKNFGKAFAVGVALNSAYVIAEVVYGLQAHSLALVADAGHNLGDVFGLLLAWGAAIAVSAKPSETRTYGLRKGTILAALVNAVVLLGTTGAIAYEAIRRFAEPQHVHGNVVIWVALAGVIVNGGTALMFMAGRHDDLNIRGAFMHMAADAALVLGVAVSGWIIMATGWITLDPIVSLLICFAVVWGTSSLLRDSANMALDAVPPGIKLDEVRTFLGQVEGVQDVHDLHVWAMSTTETALTAHLVMPIGNPDDAFLSRLCAELHDRFEIEHPTIQIERGDPKHPCSLAPDQVV
jgi:cobalt-zinc-cadmium efflux system protein